MHNGRREPIIQPRGSGGVAHHGCGTVQHGCYILLFLVSSEDTNLVVLMVAITIATILSIVATVIAAKALTSCWIFLLRYCAPFWYLGWLLLLDIEWGKTTN